MIVKNWKYCCRTNLYGVHGLSVCHMWISFKQYRSSLPSLQFEFILIVEHAIFHTRIRRIHLRIVRSNGTWSSRRQLNGHSSLALQFRPLFQSYTIIVRNYPVDSIVKITDNGIDLSRNAHHIESRNFLFVWWSRIEFFTCHNAGQTKLL